MSQTVFVNGSDEPVIGEDGSMKGAVKGAVFANYKLTPAKKK